MIRNNLGDSLEAIKPVYLKQLVSVYELSSEQKLSIYPNPAQDNISIEMNGIPKIVNSLLKY